MTKSHWTRCERTARTISLAAASLAAVFLIAGCGSTQLSENLAYVSVQSEVVPKASVRKESRHEEVCTWYIFGLPLGDIASPKVAFNAINRNAVYVNNLALYPTGFEYLFVAKRCWNADGTAVTK